MKNKTKSELIEELKAYKRRVDELVEERTAEKEKVNLELFREISKREEVEKELKREKQLTDSIMNGLPGILFMFDEQGKILHWNKYLEDMTDYSAGEIANMSPLDFFEEAEKNKIAGKIDEVFQKGEAFVEGNFQTKTGKKIPFFFKGMGAEISGKRYLVGVGVDITHQKEMQEKLRKNEERLKQYINLAGVIFVVIDSEQKVKLINRKGCEILGYKEDEIIGKNWFENFLPEKNREYVRQVFSALISGRTDEFAKYAENLVICKDGTERLIAWRNSVLKDDHGNIVATLDVGEDITERRRIKSELKEALVNSQISRNETAALLEGARSILEIKSFKESARTVFDICTNLIGATSGYVGLLTEDGTENEVLFLESGGLPCTVDPELPMPIRRLRETSYKTGKVVYENDFQSSKWVEFLPGGHVELKNVMFAPLNVDGKTVGLLGMANKPSDFTDNDARLAGAFGDLVAIALKNSYAMESLEKNERELKKLLDEKTERVKKLNCLYNLSKIVEKPDITIDELIEQAVTIIPPAWQYPEITCARIVVDDKQFVTQSFVETTWKMTSDLIVQGKKAGAIEVFYKEEKPEEFEGPFLKEERDLLDTLTERLGEVIERKRIEDALEKSEEKYRSLTENLNIGIYRSAPGSQGKYLEVNPAMIRMFGYESRDEFLKIFPSEIYVNPADRSKFSTELLEKGHLKNRELRMKKKDGTPLICSTTVSVIRDKEGNVLYFDGIVEDITVQKEFENQLYESEEKFRTISNAAIDAIIMIDNDGKITFWNPAAEKIFGYTAEEIYGKELHKFIVPSRYYKDYKKAFEEFSQSGKGKAIGKTLELEGVRRNGTEFPVELSVSAVKAGDKWGAVGILRDISERKEAEKALRESEERYKTLFTQAAEGILIADIETKKFLYANSAICEMLGYETDELIGMTLSDIHPKESLDHVMSEFEAQARGEKKLAPGFPCLKKEGTIIYVNVSTTKVIINGKECNIGFYTDITEKKRNEEEIAIERAYFKQLFEGSQEAIVLCKNDGVVRDVNEEFTRMFGYKHDEAVGKTIDELVVPDNYMEEGKKLTNVTAQGSSHKIETIRKRKDGSTLHVSILGTPIIVGDEQVGVYAIYRDITERKRAEEKVREKNKELENTLQKLRSTQEVIVQKEKLISIGTLVGGVAHEINNPAGYIKSNLNSILKYSTKFKELFDYIIEKENESTVIRQKIEEKKIPMLLDFTKEAAEDSLEGIERISQIVRDMQGFARAEEFSMEFRDINKGIESTVNVLWNELKYKTEVVKELGKIPEVKCSLQQINQAVMNILFNSVQAIEEKGTIWIRTFAKEKSVYIEIEDTGMGIPKKNLNKVTEAFFTTKLATKNPGLGLTTAQKIVMEHGGSLHIESEEGKGTKVTISLPVEQKKDNEVSD